MPSRGKRIPPAGQRASRMERINSMCELIGEKAQITAYLQGLKDKKQWTVAQWETASGVPKQTISRLLKAQVESPQFRTVAAIVIAAEGSLDELCGIAPQVEIQEKYVNSIESQEVINKGERSITYLKKTGRNPTGSEQAMPTAQHHLPCDYRRIFVFIRRAIVLGFDGSPIWLYSPCKVGHQPQRWHLV